MRRLLLCLPLCFVMAPESRPRAVVVARSAALAANAAPIPDEAGLVRLAKSDPVAFLEACARRYERDVQGYRCLLQKQERIGGKLLPTEITQVDFREDPFAVLMEWKQGARLARRVLYAKGENRDMLVVKPAGLAAIVGTVERDPEGDDAKKSGRYPLTQFGMKLGLERTIADWKKAKKDDALHVTYVGIKPIKELGDRPCHVLKRTQYKEPEADGVIDYTTYIDRENLLQVGSVLKGEGGKLIAEYLFRDVELNPKFAENAFTRAAVAR